MTKVYLKTVYLIELLNQLMLDHQNSSVKITREDSGKNGPFIILKIEGVQSTND